MLGIDLSQELHGDYTVIGADVVHGPRSMVHGFESCDVTDKKRVAEVVEGANPDVVIHAAAFTDVDGCESNEAKARAINVEGAGNVAAACRDAGAAIIYISTDFVFDGAKKTPYLETDRTRPLSIYGKSKLEGEEAIKGMTGRHYILRTSWLYGRYGKNFVDTIINKARTEKVLKVVDDQVGSPTYTKDLAKAIHALLDKLSPKPTAHSPERYGIYHISNSGTVSWYEYAKTILEMAGSGTKVIPISSKELARPANRPAMSVLDNEKFTGYTGYIMRSWKSALREYLSETPRKGE